MHEVIKLKSNISADLTKLISGKLLLQAGSDTKKHLRTLGLVEYPSAGRVKARSILIVE